MNRRQAILAAAGMALGAPRAAQAQFSTHLSSRTNQAFDAYIRDLEAKLEWKRVLSASTDGEAVFAQGNPKGLVEVHDGLIHDWIAAAVAPRTRIDDVLGVLQDYSQYRKVYYPNVTESRVLAMDGGPGASDWRIFLRLRKKQVLTAVLNSEYNIRYQPLQNGAWSMLSRSTKIAEVEEDTGKEKPVGTGHGFLWRLNAYWYLEPHNDGVYMSCRAISLTRNIPTGLGWVIKPMITTLPKESLDQTMSATIKALG